ncbi:hypothetical protein GGI25_003058 [Coemansia spiralis]|uniref:AMP-dependent synthetase/ligase domain-containing protein n=2 Tax=Coemansia TaxID=4863 RepID=A0A9W8G997_9FUNG|nr:hypothetical protein EDC05_001511 [Coemansia umbellata]KAJ2624400.1 hypothetical protein GGI26_001535 [Coemansia sp. RSA 1358]KAJ2677538.1 hypothetical protein GGI25_003058 [Coemansia spiralis]
MAPGRRTPINRMTVNGNGTSTPPLNGHGNGRRRRSQHRRRRSHYRQAQQTTELYGLPEYLYAAYERLESSSRGSSTLNRHPAALLIDVYSGHEITYASFCTLASTLATSLATRNRVSSGDTIVILATSNINVPVVAAAAWLLGASVVVLSPQLRIEELYEFLSRQHGLRSFFVSRTLLETAARLISDLGLLYSDERPHIVVFDAQDHEFQQQAANEQGSSSVTGSVWRLQDLYVARPGEAPFERSPLLLSEAQECTAVVYYNHIIARNSNQYDIEPTPMSHENIISHYNSSLRRSPSLPDIVMASYSSPVTPRSQTPILRTPSVNTAREPYTPLRESNSSRENDGSNSSSTAFLNPVAYSVLRMHQVYRLHRIIFDIFCRGAAYLVAPSFVPAEFIALADRYAISYAELTFAEIRSLVDYLRMQDMNQSLPRASWPLHIAAISDALSPAEYFTSHSIADMLGTLRFIFTESDRAQVELAPVLANLLPEVEVVRTRFGSYIEPLIEPNR